jgi:hypothetical protein
MKNLKLYAEDFAVGIAKKGFFQKKNEFFLKKKI